MDVTSLWIDVDASVVSPPALTREQVLPLGALSWENFERLCFRLAHRGGDVEDVRIYGERGQAQEGIDLYVRRASGDYATWQCKRYQEITSADIKKAVSRFLDGDWAGRTKLFHLAVAPSLNATGLTEEIERQRARCQSINVAFEILDRDRLSLMLKEFPDLVDDFFGRSWVEAFNGPEAAAKLSGRKLSHDQKLRARQLLLTLYATHFQTVDGGIPAAAPVFRGAVPRMNVFDRYVEPFVELVESVVEHGQASTEASRIDQKEPSSASPSGGFRRREIRTKVSLSAALAMGDRLLLLGAAGFGKSAALRVVVHSLLSDGSQFPGLTKARAQRLPLLLPFGFLTRHFAENAAPTIESALDAWLGVIGAKNDVLVLLREMLEDERLILFVDGLDEWQNREAAVAALTALTTFVQTRGLPLVATGRPQGFERINDLGSDWTRAELLPLTTDQQRIFARYWFKHFHQAEATLDVVALDQAVARDVAEFTSELLDESTLSELGGVPLLLSVLIYLRLTGRVLPRSRLAALEELIQALLEDQPRRRAQAAMQRADQSLVRSRRIRYGIEYLAYRIHQEPNSVILSSEQASGILRDYFRIHVELAAGEAEDWANRVLELGQNEFGVLVAPQEHHVGLLHRVFQEYLAAKYLARLPLEKVKSYCVEIGRNAPWHEVTLILLQLLERQGDVDVLIDELCRPVEDCIDEPLQKILLTRVAVAEITCSRRKANELLSQVFSWIECGRWMPLRRTLVREVAAGVESEGVGAAVLARAARWFPGRVRWLHDVPTYAASRPILETISDLRIALHNCTSGIDYRSIAEALASFGPANLEVANELTEILSGPAEPELMGAALHALATGWPSHETLASLLLAGSVAGAVELRYVAILARFSRGERSREIRDALSGFCRNGGWPWPWEDDIMAALTSGWPNDPQLMEEAFACIRGSRHSKSWRTKTAFEYLIRGCPGDDAVAQMLAEQLAVEHQHDSKLDILEVHEALLTGFSGHRLLVSASETWLAKNAATHHSQLDIAVIAQLGGSEACRNALLDWLRRGGSWPEWIISALLKTATLDDPEVRAVLIEYLSDDQRRLGAVRWLPKLILDETELGNQLRRILRDGHVFESCSALEILVEKEGADTPDLWATVEARLTNDIDGHFWRLGHRTFLKIWHERPLVRQLAIATIYGEDISRSALYEVYGSDAEIRRLLDSTMQVLCDDVRLEFIRALEPLIGRGVPGAVAIGAAFRDEPNGEARTVAARAYARHCVRTRIEVKGLIESLKLNLGGSLLARNGQQQAAVAALLELGRAEVFGICLSWDGKPLRLSTQADLGHNWEFVSTVVEHWESFAAAVPDLWERFDHSPVIATELSKAGKGGQALSQTEIFENAVRCGAQLEIEQVDALIAIHGSSPLLRELFVGRLQLMAGRQSMMSMERGAYAAMATFLTDYFREDETVRETMLAVAKSSMIRDIGLIALCRGWPHSLPIVTAAEQLATLDEGAEPVTAWLIAIKASAPVMASYVMRYPDKLRKGRYWYSEDGVSAVRDRLQTDPECRNLVFAQLQTTQELDNQGGVIEAARAVNA